MSCSNCDKIRKEMDELKDALQLKEFELEEKLNDLEDKLEWAKEDVTNLKAELDDSKSERDRYKALIQSLGIDGEGVLQAGTSDKQGNNVPRLLAMIKKQVELLEEMKSLLVPSSLAKEQLTLAPYK